MAARLDVEINAQGARVGGKQAEKALDGVRHSAREADSAVSLFNKSLLITAGFTAFVAGIGTATHASVLFKDSLAEVSTLLGDVPGELEAISEAAKDQAIQFGSLPVNQTKAFYQIISAGASSAAEATETLNAANKLAVGGVAAIEVAADGLTSVLNVYGDQVQGATDVTDTLFTGMKAGKTTITELSANIGKVAPLAEKAGVAFDELVASIAALTKGGISTAESITGVRAILATVIKPAQEAVKEAQRLGIEFNVAGLRAKGLRGFLADLEEKTKGNTATLAKLFGGVEALVPVLALSGRGAASFSEILEMMQKRAGATEEAFNKMAESPGFRIKQTLAAIAVIAIKAGDSLSSILAPALMLIVNNIEDIEKIVKIAGAAMIAMFGPSLATMLSVQLVGAFNAVRTAIIAMNIAAASNPYALLIAAVTAAGVALFQYQDELIGFLTKNNEVIDALDQQTKAQKTNTESVKDAAEAQLKLNAASEKRTKTLQNLFDGLSDQITLLELSQTATEDEIEREKILLDLKRKKISLMPGELELLNALLRARRDASAEGVLPDIMGPTPGVFDIPSTEITFQEAYNERLGEMVRNTKTAAETMGAEFANIFGPGGTLERGFANSVANSIVFGRSLQDSLVALGKQITAQLISKLIQAGIQMATTGAAAESMAATSSGAIIAGNTATTASAIQNQQSLATSSAASSTQIAAAAAPAAATTSIATAGGSSIAGQIAFTAALAAMLALVARANGLVEFAKGGAFTNKVVDSPTFFPLGKMGEAGPEAIMPLQRDSNGRLGVIAVTPPGQARPVFAPVISVNIENVNGGNAEAGEEVARQVRSQLDASFANFLRKQQRPGGQLNRQRSF